MRGTWVHVHVGQHEGDGEGEGEGGCKMRGMRWHRRDSVGQETAWGERWHGVRKGACKGRHEMAWVRQHEQDGTGRERVHVR